MQPQEERARVVPAGWLALFVAAGALALAAGCRRPAGTDAEQAEVPEATPVLSVSEPATATPVPPPSEPTAEAATSLRHRLVVVATEPAPGPTFNYHTGEPLGGPSGHEAMLELAVSTDFPDLTCSVRVWIDDAPVGSIRPGASVSRLVGQGGHRIAARAEGFFPLTPLDQEVGAAGLRVILGCETIGSGEVPLQQPEVEPGIDGKPAE